MNEATLQKEQVNLLALTIPYFSVIGAKEAKHYLRTENRGQIPRVLKRCFAIPSAIPPSAVPVEMTGYPIEETDCLEWIGHAEKFTEDHFGTKVNLRELFPLPARFPWKHILPIFDPVGLTNRQMVSKGLKAQGLRVWESMNVQCLVRSTAEVSRLYLIERSQGPTLATMGLPPKYASHWFRGRQTVPLHLRGYGLGTGLLYRVKKTFLDSTGTTGSFFPEDTSRGSRVVAVGNYFPSAVGEVRFGRKKAYSADVRLGFREAIVLNLKTQT
ncbi:MAG: hypothetical protein Q7R64_03940 [bacterium]|nr:hypothetical protein [bacterium]